MDWSRAKSILILVFVIVNIFLVANIGVFNLRSSISGETISNAKTVLKERGITLKCELPRFGSDTGMMQFDNAADRKREIIGKLLGNIDKPVESIKFGEELVKGSKNLVFESNGDFIYKDQSPSGSVNLTSKNEIEKLVRDSLQGTGLPLGKYIVDDFWLVSDKEAIIIFREKYKSFIVYDNYIGAWVSKEGITHLECRFKEVRGLTQKNKIIPAHVILLRNMEKGSGTVILGIDIGFRNKSDRSTKDLYSSPAWRVTTDDNVITYFNAYTGEVIK